MTAPSWDERCEACGRPRCQHPVNFTGRLGSRARCFGEFPDAAERGYNAPAALEQDRSDVWRALGIAQVADADVAIAAIVHIRQRLADAEREHRQWALANVRRATPDIPRCEHPEWPMRFATCVGCAHEMGRRIGHVEAGAYLTHDEAMADIRAGLTGTTTKTATSSPGPEGAPAAPEDVT